MLTRTLTIVVVNGVGLIGSAYFCHAFVSLSSLDAQRRQRQQLAVVCSVGLLCLLLGYYNHVVATPVIGLYASLLSIMVFASPLAQISVVLRTKSVATLSFSLACASTLSCTAWCAFGLLIADNNVRLLSQRARVLSSVLFVARTGLHTKRTRSPTKHLSALALCDVQRRFTFFTAAARQVTTTARTIDDDDDGGRRRRTTKEYSQHRTMKRHTHAHHIHVDDCL